ncbi:MAG TPA: hypothetical protein DCF33_20915, partial [Saprospirales bacterium]|nr:hypothetical protein [Saprospirales bacterium]
NYSGSIVQQFNVNYNVSTAVLSSDNRFLLLIYKYEFYDFSSYDIPFQIFELESNKVSTINLKIIDAVHA